MPEADGGRRPGFFVSLEGVDGAGKSTQAAALCAALRAGQRAVLSVREPGDTALGEHARGILLEHHAIPLDPWAETLLFVAARAQLLAEVVLPALERGDIVVADRFVDSTLAYQGYGRGLGEDALRRLHAQTCADVWPDLTILLRLDESLAASRRRAAELPLDRMEQSAEDFHAAVTAGFERIAAAEPGRVVVVEAGGPVVGVGSAVLAAVRSRLPEPPVAAMAGRGSGEVAG